MRPWLAAFFALAGLGLWREALREIVARRRARQALPRLAARVVTHVKERRTLVSFAGRLRARSYDVWFPVVEFTPPGGATLRQRLEVGTDDAAAHPVGSTLEVTWDPLRGRAADLSFAATWLAPLGVLLFGFACFAIAAGALLLPAP